jgi:hypothetical protein
MIIGTIYLGLMMIVLHTYETKSGSRPPAITLWAFNGELKNKFPDATRWGRWIFVTAWVLAVPLVYVTFS